MQYTYVLFFTFVLCPAVLRGMPSGPVDPANPAAVAAEPAVVAAPSVPATAPVQQTPVVSAPAPIQASEPAATGGGIVTEHKNPDGSTITVTRYNGPIPSSAFQSPLGSGKNYFLLGHYKIRFLRALGTWGVLPLYLKYVSNKNINLSSMLLSG